MLVKGITAIGTKVRITIPVQRLSGSIKTYSKSSSSSSSSSSDSSSDSDSDREHLDKTKKDEQHETIQNTSKKTSTLNNFIDRMMQEDNNEGKIDVAIPMVKSKIINKVSRKPKLSYEGQLNEAVENVTNVFRGNKEQTKIELITKLSSMHRTRLMENKKYNVENLNNLVKTMAVANKKGYRKNDNSDQKQFIPKKGVIHKLMTESANKTENIITNQFSKSGKRDIKPNAEYFEIFRNMKEPVTIIPKLSTWESLEQRALDLISSKSPGNVFQQMIQWTESGKLWTFPIDNEYGMEEEHNVHFSEHVFLERHLKDWCPKRGPVRHFMELVCIGLSKNPYMTVDEKMEHITWYKEYFKGKEELLKDLGAVDASSIVKEEVKI